MTTCRNGCDTASVVLCFAAATLQQQFQRAASHPPSPPPQQCRHAQVEHHLGLGIGNIYIVDHASEPPLATLPALAPYIASGAVEVAAFQGVPPESGYYHFQLYAYDWCLEHHRHKHTWMGAPPGVAGCWACAVARWAFANASKQVCPWAALPLLFYAGFIDTDEFIVLNPAVPSLAGLLRRYEAYGGLALAGRVLGSSGLERRPPGKGVRETFTACIPPGKKVSPFLTGGICTSSLVCRVLVMPLK